jgi:hypothetical protein
MIGGVMAVQREPMKNTREELTPLARREGLVVQRLDDEVLVYDLERHRAHCLNRTAAAIWGLCDGHTPIAAVVSKLAEDGHAAVDVDMVRYGLRQLAKFRLLEQRLPDDAALSRRQLLKRLGVSATVSLPVVASILAPRAAEAVSCVGSGQSCASLPCCTGCICIGGTCSGTC